ncbi:MAG TPA: DUF488 domain-containing protein [Candidatus Angelobacter sp.]|nr:DUF488 domain-containing protein [Candidatus Angelobacter sp.]
MSTPLIFTIGHSTRTLEELVGLLQAYGVRLVVDVRTVPRSRRNPQFNQENLSAGLKESGMDYVQLKELGGLRHPKRDSQNKGWRNESFRGFADYMQTPEFEAGINELIRLAQDGPVAIMCAEALPWRCHRSLIADALLVRGISVEHIMTLKARIEHSMTKWAHVNGKQITYPESPA